MILMIGIVISLTMILVASYLSFVLTTLIISEDFGDRVTLKVAFILPPILVSLSLYACLKNLKSNKQLAKTSLKMATTHYPTVITMFIGMIKDHQAQIQCFGESTYSYNKNKEEVITKKEIEKSWLTSFPNIKSLLTSDGFKRNFFDNLAEA
ncbi:hypothetical protein MTQ94_08765 [Staphylococcus agnetis]|uniref:hypothetical protein n=1 Tax=Staphylococcus agnetis TaxID=985762 RepID=UPI000D0468E9|nr:hypothetical protein [Staphylococcus agnetis]MCO4339244.1 hypothetical protein [Staphylococcus agnetis]MCO4341233.1 hypothetical protein [Staphylococcus agnetis]MCO4343867.1 hypothetical protein [Staphylococcus agnetis]MCO4346120.1 hypothetical protein [Staphylococcus agnetis]MCO4348296.1 hypothetical protein [Staphylococcus agnetis]